MNKVKAYALLVLAFLLFVVCAASTVALVFAFTSKSTLAAVESIFGTLVIIFLLLILAGKAYGIGKSYLQHPVNKEGVE